MSTQIRNLQMKKDQRQLWITNQQEEENSSNTFSNVHGMLCVIKRAVFYSLSIICLKYQWLWIVEVCLSSNAFSCFRGPMGNGCRLCRNLEWIEKKCTFVALEYEMKLSWKFIAIVT